MSTDDALATPSSPTPVTVCPNCGRKVSPTAQICGVCLRPVQGGKLDEGGLAALEQQRRVARRRSRLRRAAVLLTTLTAVGVFAYFQWIRPPDPLATATVPSLSVVSATEDPTQWPTAAGNSQLHRATSARPNLDAPERWRFAADGRITTQIVVGERHLYFGTSTGSLIAVSREDGREAWRIPIAGQLDAAPTIVGDRLYVPLREGTIRALRTADGSEIWKGGDGPSYFSSPTVSDGIVYGAALGRITGIDAETSDTIWREGTDNRVAAQAAAAVAPGHVVALTYRRALLFDRANGQQLFYYSMPAPEHVMVQGDRGVIVAQDRIVAFGFEHRRPWWEFFRTAWGQLWLFGMAPAPPPQPRHWVQSTERGVLQPAYSEAEGALIVATTTGTVRALEMGNGSVRWEVKPGPLASAPIVTGAGVLLVQREALVLLDPATGQERARRPVPAGNLRSAAVTSAGTYVISGDGLVIGLR